MLVPLPLVDGDCLVKILRGERLTVEIFPQLPGLAYLIRGDSAPWGINLNSLYYQPQIAAVFAVAGLAFDWL